MNLDRLLLAVQGYLELDMPKEALREFSLMNPVDLQQEDMLQIKLFILMRNKLWGEALEICKHLQKMNPEITVGYLHGAFCLHELSETAEAKKMLLGGPVSLSRDPTYYYNLACYEAILGEIENAKQNLQISFKMDEKFKKIAQKDPDLTLIRHMI